MKYKIKTHWVSAEVDQEELNTWLIIITGHTYDEFVKGQPIRFEGTIEIKEIDDEED